MGLFSIHYDYILWEIDRRSIMSSLFNKILVPYDGSSYADKALDIACRLSKDYGSEVRVLYVIDASHAWVIVGGITLSLKDRFVAEAKKLLFKAKEYAKEKYGIIIEEKLRIGHPANDIIEEAEEWGADLIIMGAKGISGLKRLLLGSVTQVIVSHARCNVLIVR